MKICQINSVNNTNFCSNLRWIYSASNEPLYRTTTCLLRNDLNWKEYIYTICAKYKDINKVNVVIHACSNGLEAYSFILSLMHFKPNEIDKFCPIIARDILKDNIEQAKSGRIEIKPADILRISNFTQGNGNKYFDTIIRNSSYFLKPKKELSDKIVFEQGDIFTDIKKLPEQNLILHCRNFWSYLTPAKRELLLGSISKRFKDDSSLLLTGDYDFNCNLEQLLNIYGFVEDLNVINMYSKRGDLKNLYSFL